MAERMPALFVGHGSPMNAIEEGPFTAGWRAIAAELPRPRAVLAISAHWYTTGTWVNDVAHPRQVYDMYGFPQALYDYRYPAPGDPELAHEVEALLPGRVQTDDSWGIDHGIWAVANRLFPEADVPIVEMSVDRNLTPREHFEMGRALGVLRDDGVLVLGSGNVVHNLALLDWGKEDGFPWADAFDDYVHDRILEGDFDAVVDYHRAGGSETESFYTPEHFLPLLYVLGASRPGEPVRVVNRARCLGALSMTCYRLG